MNPVHVILAVESLDRSLTVSRLVERHPQYQIEAVVHDEISAILAVMRLREHPAFPIDEPVVVITSVTSRHHVPGNCERLLDEFPDITVVGLDEVTGALRTYRTAIDVREVSEPMEQFLDRLPGSLEI